MVQRSGHSTCGYHGWSPWRTCLRLKCIELLNKLFYSGCLGTFRQLEILIFQKSPLRLWRSQPACDDRQLRTLGDDGDIIHTFHSPLPHSVSRVLDLTWSHRRLVTTNQKVMSGHFPVFRVENETPKPYALRVHFKRHKTKSRFYTVKSNRSSHIRRRSHTAEVSSNSDKEDISRSSQHYGCNESSVWSDSQRFKCVLSESLGCLVFQHTRVFSILWFMLLLTVLMISSHVSQESWSTFAIFWSFFYWTDLCSICTIASSSFLSSCCTRSEYSSEWIIIVSKNIGGFTEHCWATWTIPHRSCYCRSVGS